MSTPKKQVVVVDKETARKIDDLLYSPKMRKYNKEKLKLAIKGYDAELNLLKNAMKSVSNDFLNESKNPLLKVKENIKALKKKQGPLLKQKFLNHVTKAKKKLQQKATKKIQESVAKKMQQAATKTLLELRF